MISEIKIKSIPHKSQRYETVGDWVFDEKGLKITVSDMRNEDYFFLVGLHELIEAWLCRKRGISEESITEFDKNFEAARQGGNTDEPGDDLESPYCQEHLIATGIEKLLCSLLNIKWSKYDDVVNSLQ